ncbi:unnamed protein product [Adineta steineri]|uniref:Small ribosomal subunit protein mS39 n=1 Tax=Adineta steineri TaxID=433720 RepID=A0A814BWL1_9BILA|nr:unnamed protein product [Adineta steineri]
MNWNKITKAYEIYKKCLENNVDISTTCKYALFDLLCIYNSENPMDTLPPEEDWYRRELNETNQSGLTKRTWKDNGLAEQMFEELKLSATSVEQKIRLYNSFASGLLKYNYAEKAMTILDEMRQNKISIDLTTYNYLLRSISSIKESYEARWQFITECLQDMKQNSIQPNLRTFNSILYTLRRCSVYEQGPILALSILKEMRQCGIEPSLGTWAHIIMIFYPNDQIGYETQILPQIMDELEKQYESNGHQFQWKDIDDSEFFFNAMFKATVNCRDIDLVYEQGPILALSILKEMRQCGIEPSLGTWAHIIMIFYPNDQIGYETQILPQIMDELEKQYESNGHQFQWKDIDDSEFFFNAMFKATVNCRDIDLESWQRPRITLKSITAVICNSQ